MTSLAQSFGAIFANQHPPQQHQYYDLDSTITSRQRKMKVTRSGISLSQEQKMELIDYIHARPQIWDTKNEGFRTNQTRQSAFNEVAQLLSNDQETLTRIQIQEEWGKLRYCFTRIVKKMLEESDGGQITAEQLGGTTWAFFMPMAFLLEGVVEQLQMHGSADGEEGNAQENMKSTEDTPMKQPKFRRRRTNISRKSSHDDDHFSIVGVDHEPRMNQSTNDLLMSQVLGLNPQQLLMANFTDRLNNARHLEEGKQMAAVQGNNQQQQAEAAVAAALQLRNVMEEQTKKMEEQEKNLRRKRRGSNLDFLLDSSIRPPQCVEQQSPPSSLANSFVGLSECPRQQQQSPPIKSRTIAESIISGGDGGESPDALQQQQQQANTEILDESGDGEGGSGGGAGDVRGRMASPAAENIIESFGRYIVQQIKKVSKKSELLSVQMRKELVDVCYTYEMRACGMDDNEDEQP